MRINLCTLVSPINIINQFNKKIWSALLLIGSGLHCWISYQFYLYIFKKITLLTRHYLTTPTLTLTNDNRQCFVAYKEPAYDKMMKEEEKSAAMIHEACLVLPLMHILGLGDQRAPRLPGCLESSDCFLADFVLNLLKSSEISPWTCWPWWRCPATPSAFTRCSRQPRWR